MYKLVFRGELAEGAVRADVVAKLALLLKQPPARIEQLLFSGTERVIKRVDNLTRAIQWQNAFANAGAVLTIVDETAVEPTPPVTESPSISNTTDSESSVAHSDSSDHPAATQSAVSATLPKLKFRKLIIGLVACLLVVVVSAAIVWQQGYLNRWLFSAVSKEEKTLLAAMADPQLLALARVDIELMRTLDPSLAEAGQLQNLPGVDADMWSSMERSGIHIQQQATQLYAAAFVADKMEVAVIARGNFSPDKISRWLDEQYGIDKQDADGIWFAPLDKTTCAKGEPMLAQFTQGQLLIGSPEAVKRIALRLKNATGAAVDLAQWQNSLGGKLFSLVIFSPARWQADKSGMVQYSLGKLAAEMEAVSEVYVDVEPDVVAQGMTLSLSLISGDAEFINNTHTALQTRLDETRKKIAQDWPEVVAIYDRLQLSRSTKQLQASIRFDQHIKDEVAIWFRSLFSFSVGMDQPTVAQQDVIDENPAAFAPARREQLTSFVPKDDFMDGIYKTTTGPFGLGVESLALKNQRIQIKLGVKAYDLPNLGNESSPAFLVITDVVDQQGNSLLSAPGCGETDQRAPEAINNSYATSRFEDGKLVPGRALIGEKIIELAAGVNFAQVARIKGYIDYHLPIAVETKIIDAPLAGKSIDLYGTRVRFKTAGASALSFETSGNTQQLLQVNALNATNKPLSSSSGMRSGIFFGSGKSASLDFKGTVAKAEVIVASAIENQRYEFELNQLTPPAKAFFMDKEFPPPFGDKGFEQLLLAQAPQIDEFPFYPPKARATAAPVELAINDVRSSNSFGLSVEGAAYTDLALPLYGQIGVAQLFIKQLADADGKIFPVNKSVPLYFERQGGITSNGVYQPDEKTPWLRSDFSLKAADVRVDNIRQVQGELRFYQPKRLQTATLPFVLGPIWSGPKSSVELIEWKSGRLVFAVQGSYEEVIGLKAFNHANALISQPAQYSSIFGDPQLTLDISELPARFEIEYTSESEELFVPFDITLP